MNRHVYNYSGEVQHERSLSIIHDPVENENCLDIPYYYQFSLAPNNKSVSPKFLTNSENIMQQDHFCLNNNSSENLGTQPGPASLSLSMTNSIPNLTTSTSQQTQATLKWLEVNFHERDSVSISRSTIYDLYVRFCELNYFSSVCKATFGKLIRSKFVNVKSKRLGARGQSKYHYYNISFRDSQKRCFMRLDSGGQLEHHLPASDVPSIGGSSENLDGNYSYENVRNNNPTSFDRLLSCQNIPLNDSTSHQTLTIFSTKPADNDFTTFNLNGSDYHGVIQEMLSFMKVPLREPLTDQKSVFINLYRIHCQCLIDAILSSNYAQIRHYFIHFWKQLPLSLIDIPSMRALDYKMLELLERFFLANVDIIDWKQVININTMLQLIPEWFRILLDSDSFDNTCDESFDDPEYLTTFFQTKLQFSQSISARFKSKVDFLLILERLSTIDIAPICSYLQELSCRYRRQSLLFDNISENIPSTFKELLATLETDQQNDHNNIEKASFKRCLIDSLDKFFQKLLNKTQSSICIVCSKIVEFFSHLNRSILDDSLMENCDEFEDIISEEEYEMPLNTEKQIVPNDLIDSDNSASPINSPVQNDVRLFLLVIENYCFEICQNFNQKSNLENYSD